MRKHTETLKEMTFVKPFEIGQTVFVIWHYKNGDKIREGTITAIVYDRYGWRAVYRFTGGTKCRSFTARDVGVTVFNTEQEATNAIRS